MKRAGPLLTYALLALPGCAAETGSAPSLLPRAIEKQGIAEPAPAPDPTAAPDPELDARIADLIAAREKASADFAAADRAAAPKLAAGAKAAVGGDAWLDAQTALGTLDDPRSTLAGTLTDLEQLAIQRAADGKPPYPALEAARAAASAEVDRVTALIAERKAAFPL